jgi:hypothetical protein
MTNYVNRYSSLDLNAPPLTGQASSLITVLNACLVDGYNFTISPTSITRSGTTATVTCSALDILKLQTGGYYTIAGASQSDYNVTAQITIASTTTFTYTVANSPATPATGTITIKTALPITGITRVGNVALVNTTVANSTMATGDIFTVAGAAQTDYNITAAVKVANIWVNTTAYALGDLVTNDTGKLYVCRTAGTSAASGGPTGTSSAITDGTVSWDYVAATGQSANYFTYVVANTPTTPATGTITHYKAHLQWTRPFAAGTNRQTYRSADVTSNQFYLQVNDEGTSSGTGAHEAAVFAGEMMSADNVVNNGGGANSGRFPTTLQASTGSANWRKSDSADTIKRPWDLWGDDRTFYIAVARGKLRSRPPAMPEPLRVRPLHPVQDERRLQHVPAGRPELRE